MSPIRAFTVTDDGRPGSGDSRWAPPCPGGCGTGSGDTAGAVRPRGWRHPGSPSTRPTRRTCPPATASAGRAAFAPNIRDTHDVLGVPAALPASIGRREEPVADWPHANPWLLTGRQPAQASPIIGTTPSVLRIASDGVRTPTRSVSPRQSSPSSVE